MAEKTAKSAKKKAAVKKMTVKTYGSGKNLVIVESPTKAKTISKYLGRDFSVQSSVGHIRDLPKKKLGIDIENGFQPEYVNLPDKKAVINSLKKAARTASRVYLAPDPDREGEAIAWHLHECLKLSPENTFRVSFNEFTKRAIEQAFSEPRKIDMNLVNAQQARRVLDRLVGYELSPLLWRKITRGLSAGRVQSVAVRMICEREAEIAAFEPEEYWKIAAVLMGGGKEFTAELRKKDGKGVKIPDEAAARAICAELDSEKWQVESVERRDQRNRPLPPFNTSMMQQQAATRMGFAANRTMRIAQSLYEGVEIPGEGSVGLITYMRTDSYHIAPEAIETARRLITDKYGAKYLPEKPNIYRSKKNTQEAHEAIRPSDPLKTPEAIEKYLNADQFKLYRLIWQRFVASQMVPAEFDSTTILIKAGAYTFGVRGRVLKFDGHLKVAGYKPRDDEQDLPALGQGDFVEFRELKPTQHFTQPPPRFSEAALIKALENRGIGRPSTYATIISTIQERKYVEQKDRVFYATQLGIAVNKFLCGNFEKILDYDFTSHIEEELDSITEKKLDWVQVIDEFYRPFRDDLSKAKDIPRQAIDSDVKCPECGGAMAVKFSSYGMFLGCAKYPECKKILSIEGEEIVRAAAPESTEYKCDKCEAPMVIRTSRKGARFFACSAYPKCRNTWSIGEDGKPLRSEELAEKTDEKCEKCQSPMTVKMYRGQKFLACSAYPKCRFTKALPVEEKCPLCGKEIVQKKGKGRGKYFYACSGYPECTFTASSIKAIQTAITEKDVKADAPK